MQFPQRGVDDPLSRVEASAGKCELCGMATHGQRTAQNPDSLSVGLIRDHDGDGGGPGIRIVDDATFKCCDAIGGDRAIDGCHTFSSPRSKNR
ncbi:Uncharacterised protein [Mycobacteroides abscessus subsp. abscessus]|nr:Uncharacterised protein [Mycobacteroides abscessus subsp. abscessus]